jgi:hypothetical protein
VANIIHYDLEDYWVTQSTFTVSGTPTDPTTLTVKQQAPDGTETVLAAAVSPAALNAGSTPVAKVSTGVFKLNPGIQLTAAGRWYVKFTGTGAASASETHEAIADPDVFTLESGVDLRALVTLAETKDWLNQQNVSTENDLEIVRAINDMSALMHNEAEREFKVSGTNPQVRTFETPQTGTRYPWYIDGDYQGDIGRRFRTIQVGDLAAFTAVQIIDYDWTTVLSSPAVGLVTGHPLVRQSWEPIRELELHTDVSALSPGMRVKVTGTWGFPSVPGDVRQATLDAIVAVLDRDVEHYRQDLGAAASAEGGGTTIVVGRTGQKLLALPPQAAAVAWRYRAVSVSVG